jgi:hypothetical protein
VVAYIRYQQQGMSLHEHPFLALDSYLLRILLVLLLIVLLLHLIFHPHEPSKGFGCIMVEIGVLSRKIDTI